MHCIGHVTSIALAHVHGAESPDLGAPRQIPPVSGDYMSVKELEVDECNNIRKEDEGTMT